MRARGYLNGVRLLGLKEMRARSKPGECIACGDDAIPLSSDPALVAKRRTGRTHQDTCGAPECQVAWFRFWRRDERMFGRKPRHHVVPFTHRENMKRGARKARQPEMTRRMVEGHRRRNAA